MFFSSNVFPPLLPICLFLVFATVLLWLFSHSVVWLSVTPWTVACQAPLSMGFLRQEYWCCHFLLQGIFPTQGLNPSLLLGRQFLYHWATWEVLAVVWGSIFVCQVWELLCYHYPGSMVKCRLLGPTPELLNQNIWEGGGKCIFMISSLRRTGPVRAETWL